MPVLEYAVYDVFSEKALEGNPLAVVFDADALDTALMQAIAREFNLSETAFVQKPNDPLHAARLRIFTPDHEMPFAGHPTVGSAIAVVERRAESPAPGPEILVLEENIGPMRCAVERRDGAAFAEFDLPRLPERLELAGDPALYAAALGLSPHEIGFENHVVGLWSAGVPYVTVPVRGLGAAARARLDSQEWTTIAPLKENGARASAYLYCRETVAPDCAFHARMFVPGGGTYEDPATGSAAAAFIGVIRHFDDPPDGTHRFWIEQGVEMGRPSRLRLEFEVGQGALRHGRVGGAAVMISEGRIKI